MKQSINCSIECMHFDSPCYPFAKHNLRKATEFMMQWFAKLDMGLGLEITHPTTYRNGSMDLWFYGSICMHASSRGIYMLNHSGHEFIPQCQPCYCPLPHGNIACRDLMYGGQANVSPGVIPCDVLTFTQHVYIRSQASETFCVLISFVVESVQQCTL